ncbi:MAG: DUF2064 domain-containing protein [Spirochaetes bacterium]|nr:DUF2064 domain-containing protein [Spirochaetota bacterium]HOD14798.1 DUF2064 domain-containing protein [Spirochaetota bacterium]HPG50199.1 DUF2064 domain-containing protein [Spirochaetota bacterium]
MSEAVILFIHYPEPGSVIPGLERELGADLALELEVCIIRDLLDAAHNAGAVPVVVGTGSRGAGPPGIFGDALRLVQHGRDTGARRYNAFADVLGRGVTRAVMVCGGVPGVSADLLRSAFAELDDHDAVLGPDKDGACYLIGLKNKALSRELFYDLPWGTSREFMKTMGRIESVPLGISVLPQREKVRDREGLVRFIRDGALQGSSTHVTGWVERHRVEVYGKA